jgi:hypothetical protein
MGCVATVEEKYSMYKWGRGVYRVIVGKTERNRPLGKPRCRWESNIRIYLQEIGFQGVEWIDLAQERYVFGCYD